MTDKSVREFDSRAEDYARFRPSYPPALLDLVTSRITRGDDFRIADLGAGTGIFTALLAERGISVVAVEPNLEMCDKLTAVSRDYPHVTVLNAKAEATSIASHSIDAIVVAQAFHFFEKDLARVEFERILKTSDSPICLIWNVFDEGWALNDSFSEMIRAFAKDKKHAETPRLREQNGIDAFFFPKHVRENSFSHSKLYDLTSFVGQIFSFSYLPQRHTPEGEALQKELTAFWYENAEDGFLSLPYISICYSSERR